MNAVYLHIRSQLRKDICLQYRNTIKQYRPRYNNIIIIK